MQKQEGHDQKKRRRLLAGATTEGNFVQSLKVPITTSPKADHPKSMKELLRAADDGMHHKRTQGFLPHPLAVQYPPCFADVVILQL